MKIKILFQGDSITDAGRDRTDNYNLGLGYPLYAAELLKERFKDVVDFEFINLGIGAEQTKDLLARLQPDFIDVKADIVSILVGVNDVWHHAAERDWLPNEVFEQRYRAILEGIKSTGAKLMMIEPYLGPVPDKAFFREDLNPKIDVIRALAREYADVYMPLDGLLASEFIGKDHYAYLYDGVHPAETGARFIGKVYVDYITPLVEEVIKTK